MIGDRKFVFLARPRRFGKSLLVNTLHAYFEDKKELFKGLKTYELEKNWTKYPVMKFDMSSYKDMSPKDIAALAQINSKNYSIPYKYDGREIVKTGVNISDKKHVRTITEWKVEK